MGEFSRGASALKAHRGAEKPLGDKGCGSSGRTNATPEAPAAARIGEWLGGWGGHRPDSSSSLQSSWLTMLGANSVVCLRFSMKQAGSVHAATHHRTWPSRARDRCCALACRPVCQLQCTKLTQRMVGIQLHLHCPYAFKRQKTGARFKPGLELQIN
jgi:hypothetical protein